MSIKIFGKYGDPRRIAAAADQDPHGLAPTQVERMAQRMEEMLPKLSSQYGNVRTVLDDILPKDATLAPNAGAGYRSARQKHANLSGGLGSGQGNTGTMQTVQRPYQPEYASSDRQSYPVHRCLVEGTEVLYATGQVAPIEDVKIGDKLLGPDGKPRLVLDSWSESIPDQLIEIRWGNGRTDRCTPEHLWPTTDGLKQAQDLKRGDFGLAARKFECGESIGKRLARLAGYYAAEGSIQRNFINKGISGVKFSLHIKETHLADDITQCVLESFDTLSLSSSDQKHSGELKRSEITSGLRIGRLQVTSDKYRIGTNSFVDTICDCGNSGSALVSTLVSGNTDSCGCRAGFSTCLEPKQSSRSLYIRKLRSRSEDAVAKKLADWLIEHVGEYSSQKVLSPTLMALPLDEKIEFLVGYLRGDGSKRLKPCSAHPTSVGREVSFITTSHQMGHQIALMLLQCGFPGHINITKDRKYNDGVERLDKVDWSIYGEGAGDLARLVWADSDVASHTPDIQHPVKMTDEFAHIVVREVKFIDNTDRQRVYDLTVSDDHVYCLSNGLTTHNTLANRYWRLFYKLDPVIGTCLDMYGELPWGDVSFSGDGVDGEVKDVMEYSWDTCRMRSILPAATREYYVVGEAAPHLFFDDSKGCWTYCALHNPDQLEIIDAPFIKMDPVAEFVPDDRLRQVLHSTHHSLQRVRESMPQELLSRLTSGQNIPLSPINFTFLPRKLHPYDTRGTSVISRLWRILMYEDAIYEASLATARRHAAPLKVAKLGDPTTGFMPGPEHEQHLLELLAQAELDSNAWLVYHHAVQFETIGTTDRVMTIDKHNEVIERVKLIALGVSKAFLSGEVTYASAATGLTVFLRRLKSVRQHFEASWLLPKFFLQMAKINKWVKPTQAELDHRVRIRRSSRELHEDGRYILPTLEWDRSLDPSVDGEMIGAMQNLQQLGITFSKSTLHSLVGRDFEDESRQRVSDLEFEQKVFKDHPELMSPSGDAGMGGGGGMMGGGGSIPGLDPASFGDLEQGEGGGAADIPVPDGASATADADGKPKPTRPNPFKETDRIGIWSKSDVDDLIDMMNGEVPDSDPWVDAYKNIDVQRALKTGDADEIWEAVEDYLADEQFPSSAVSKLVDILKAMKVLGDREGPRTPSARAKEAQLLEMIDGYGNPDVGF